MEGHGSFPVTLSCDSNCLRHRASLLCSHSTSGLAQLLCCQPWVLHSSFLCQLPSFVPSLETVPPYLVGSMHSTCPFSSSTLSQNSTCYWCALRTWPLSSSLWLNGTQGDPWSWHQSQPGALLVMRILRSQPRHTESETLGMGPTICVVTRPLGGSESIEGTYPTGFCLRYNLKF